MKRWLASLFIGGYLSALGVGLVSHTMEWGTGRHPAMYYIVWDMFCGWTSWDVRLEVIGEGVSGKYYSLAPGPWGGINTHGRLDRRDYDVGGLACCRIALNTLKHTSHEEIARIFVVERAWNKKYNIPDHLWEERFEEPRDPHYYHKIYHVISGEGVLLSSQPNWLTHYTSVAQNADPRLQSQMRTRQPFYLLDMAAANNSGQELSSQP
ncbi:hypothetical protein [Stratiformator vulcanicus]|uniref:Uncharacterized protein n=1 Tax=Stratiformator vulcanicus TaxID=2527980 RepID=A0A517R327_9PLAN|nr:hypothetical protein [Stratiformator vulcanicus]QDT38282.1 hypothetical protein Pan189_26720 [Stratiformator vulcanicus]